MDFLINFLAGGLAGSIAKTVSAPAERVKLLLQTENMNDKLKRPYKGIFDCLSQCIRKEGYISLWRGNFINCVRYFPTQALNFSFKEFLNQKFNHYTAEQEKNKYILANFLIGGLAGCGSQFFVYPLDLVRTRISTDLGREVQNRQFKGIIDCIKQIFISDGIFGLYQGFGSGLVGLFLYRGCYFGFYDSGKEIFLQGKNKNSYIHKYFLSQIIVLFSEALTYPLDTIKRELMMQSGKKIKIYKNSFQCAKQIYQNNGIQAFYKGQLTNIFRSFGSSLTLVLYDVFKDKYNSNKNSKQ